METIHHLLGILCLTLSGQSAESTGHILVAHSVSIYRYERILVQPGYRTNRFTANQKKKVAVLKILSIARGEIGVRELSGHNDGLRVEEYLHYVHLKKGNPWCAAFVSWVFRQAGFTEPQTGWSPSLFPKNRLLSRKDLENEKTVLEGMVFGIYFPTLNRIAHSGLIERRSGNWICTIEGNTNVIGSREGDGVYRKRRALRLVHSISMWHRPLQQPGNDQFLN